VLHADSARNRLIGIGLVSLTYLLFSLLDGSAKWRVGTMPVIVVVWLRFVTHVLFAVVRPGSAEFHPAMRSPPGSRRAAGSSGRSPACSASWAASDTTCSRSRTVMLPPR